MVGRRRVYISNRPIGCHFLIRTVWFSTCEGSASVVPSADLLLIESGVLKLLIVEGIYFKFIVFRFSELKGRNVMLLLLFRPYSASAFRVFEKLVELALDGVR